MRGQITLIVCLALTVLPCVAFAGGSIGTEIDLSLYQFLGDGYLDFTADNGVDGEFADYEFTTGFSPGMGITVNYEFPGSFFGGKFLYAVVKGDGDVKSSKFEDDGSFDMKMIQFGPRFGYYFRERAVHPMLLLELTYNQCELSPAGGKKGTLGMVGMHTGVGMKAFVKPRIAIGGGARIDYYLTVSHYEQDASVGGVNGSVEGDIQWIPLSAFFFAEYHWGYGGVAPGSQPGPKYPEPIPEKEEPPLQEI
jgi:hypothetical protein